MRGTTCEGVTMWDTIARSLLTRPITERGPEPGEAALKALAARADAAARTRLGRSLAIRHVDAGSCNGCELELHALSNPYHDLERFGLRFVASPRHADVLLVTGVVTLNMAEALLRTWRAMPEPKWVIASGDCAATGGLFAAAPACLGPVSAALPVDLHIRGCPPGPMQLLEGLVALVETQAR